MFRDLQRKQAQQDQGLGTEQLLLTEWVVSTRCCCHHVHNALKWGLWSAVRQDTECLDALWQVLRAVRHSAGLIQARLKEWLLQVLVYAPTSDLAPVEERSALWSALGLSDEDVETRKQK